MSKLRDQRIEILKELSKRDGGLITTSQIEKAGISRVLIPTFINDRILTRKRRGIYYYKDIMPDEFYILQKKNPRAIYSYRTALYLWNMTDHPPDIWDLSVPQGFNARHLKKGERDLRLHYINADRWDIGITAKKTPLGNQIRLYDKERCIVDLIKRKDKMDKQLYLDTLHAYFKDETNDHAKLLTYAKSFHIEGPVRDYVEILTDGSYQ